MPESERHLQWRNASPQGFALRSRCAPNSFSAVVLKFEPQPCNAPQQARAGDNRLQLLALRRNFSTMMKVYLPGLRLLHTAATVQPLGPG